MSFTFPFDCKTRDGRDATILGYSQKKGHLIGFIHHGGISNHWQVSGHYYAVLDPNGTDLILPLNPQPGKTYRTRGGLVAKINLRSDHPEQQDCPQRGHVIFMDGSVGAHAWTDTGLSCATRITGLDLIEEIQE